MISPVSKAPSSRVLPPPLELPRSSKQAEPPRATLTCGSGSTAPRLPMGNAWREIRDAVAPNLRGQVLPEREHKDKYYLPFSQEEAWR